MSDGKPVLVLGGGIAGITAAVEAAEAGCEVILAEKSPSLGGRVARSNLYFPKLCPPACGLEINYRRIRANPRITVLTQAELEQLSGLPGDFEATLRIEPRYVTADCTGCGECSKVCPAEIADEYNSGMAKTKAVRLPFAAAYPARYALERSACPAGCEACVKACSYNAIDLQQQAERKTLRVAAVIAATGWAPYDASKLTELGFGKYPNVITNVMLERLAAVDGPTGGRILRPSDQQPPGMTVFVQCAGSRDENHLPYCSAVCCTASFKQTAYLRSQYPDSKAAIFYIDIRTPGRLEEFQARVAADGNVALIKGKVVEIAEDPETKDLLVAAEDVLRGKKITWRANLVVLATGIVPQRSWLPAGFSVDEYGFISSANGRSGCYAAGCAHRPEEVSASVQEATAAALKALQCVVRGHRNA